MCTKILHILYSIVTLSFRLNHTYDDVRLYIILANINQKKSQTNGQEQKKK